MDLFAIHIFVIGSASHKEYQKDLSFFFFSIHHHTAGLFKSDRHKILLLPCDLCGLWHCRCLFVAKLVSWLHQSIAEFTCSSDLHSFIDVPLNPVFFLLHETLRACGIGVGHVRSFDTKSAPQISRELFYLESTNFNFTWTCVPTKSMDSPDMTSLSSKLSKYCIR